MGTLSSSNALTDSKRRVLLLKRRYGLDIRSDLNGMRISTTARTRRLQSFRVGFYDQKSGGFENYA